MAKKPIESRSVKVDITIQEKREGSYSTENIATHSLQVRLPANSVDIAAAVKDALDLMRGTTNRFHGEVADIDAEAVLSSEASV